MTIWTDDLQIFQPIIARIPVDVMNFQRIPTFIIESPGFLIEDTYTIALRSRGKEGEV